MARVVHVCVPAQLCLALCNPIDCNPPAPLSTGFPRQEYWSGLPSLEKELQRSSRHRDQTCISVSPALAGRFFTTAPCEKTSQSAR